MANSKAFIKPKGKDTTWVRKKTSSLKVDKKKKLASATGRMLLSLPLLLLLEDGQSLSLYNRYT